MSDKTQFISRNGINMLRVGTYNWETIFDDFDDTWAYRIHLEPIEGGAGSVSVTWREGSMGIHTHNHIASGSGGIYMGCTFEEAQDIVKFLLKGHEAYLMPLYNDPPFESKGDTIELMHNLKF